MITVKRLGIWMDHSSAHLTEYSNDPVAIKIITSKFTHEDKEHSLVKGESLMHKKEQHKHAEYYKEIGEAIKDYDEVILFGPTDAKVELYNILRSDHLFSGIKIETKQADKMTEYQQHAFIKEYFTTLG
jgi:stalled ribosome rescue protein Dom34